MMTGVGVQKDESRDRATGQMMTNQRSGSVRTLAGGVEARSRPGGRDGKSSGRRLEPNFGISRLFTILGTAKRNQPTKDKGHETKSD